MQVEEFIEKYNQLAPQIYRDPGVLTVVEKVYLAEQARDSERYEYSLSFTAQHDSGPVISYPMHAYAGAVSVEDHLDWIYGMMERAKQDVEVKFSPRLAIEGLE